MSNFTIDEVSIPKSIDDADAAPFIESVEVRNEVEAFAFGSRELALTAAELLPGWWDQVNTPRKLFVARIKGRIVARTILETQAAGATEICWIDVEVLPEFRRMGIGTALAETSENLAREAGIDRAVTYIFHPPGPGEQLLAPTGFGSIPKNNHEARFLTARGYTLEQVDRCSRVKLPIDSDELADRLSAAKAASGADYTVHCWMDHTPERFLEDMAVLATRMSTDAPSAGLEEPEDVWTVERLVDYEKRYDESPRTMLTAAVEHVPSGHLVGFTDLSIAAEIDRAVNQQATIVIKEHRGHKLGMLIKVANFDYLQRERPGYPAILTFNAEENRPMLNVNEAVGFVPAGSVGAWKKVL